MQNTENAGKELRRRIERTLAQLGLPPSVYNVDTIGSMFVGFLRDYAEEFKIKGEE